MNNPIGICQWCVPASDYAAAIQVAAQCGLDGIELDLGHSREGHPLSRPRTQEICLRLRVDLGVRFPSMSVNMFCDVGLSDPDREQEVFETLERAAETAAALDIPLLQFPSFFSGAIESEEQFQQTVRALQFACQCAEPHGIHIGSENALNADEQGRLLDEVSHPLLGLYFDVRNPLSMKGLDGPSILDTIYDKVVEVHLKDGIDDGRCVPLGEGNCGVLESIAILKKREYAGWLVLEGSYKEMADQSGKDPLALIRNDIASIRSW